MLFFSIGVYKGTLFSSLPVAAGTEAGTRGPNEEEAEAQAPGEGGVGHALQTAVAGDGARTESGVTAAAEAQGTGGDKAVRGRGAVGQLRNDGQRALKGELLQYGKFKLELGSCSLLFHNVWSLLNFLCRASQISYSTAVRATGFIHWVVCCNLP